MIYFCLLGLHFNKEKYMVNKINNDSMVRVLENEAGKGGKGWVEGRGL